MFQPWVAHLFPGLTLDRLEAGLWTLSGFVAMGDFARSRSGEG